MISNPQSKRIRSLKQKKFRDRYGQYVAEGEKIVGELIRSGPDVTERIMHIFATPEWLKLHEPELAGVRFELTGAGLPELKKVSNLVSPPPVLALMKKANNRLDPGHIPEGTILVFDAIRDPGNLGTILRTADWFGIRTVICSEDSVDHYNPKAVQAAMGALERISVHSMELETLFLMEGIKEKRVYGTYVEGSSIYKEQLIRESIVLFGSESHGLSGRYDPLVQRRISIPSFPVEDPIPESLNLAAAVAVVCSEFRREFP